MTIISFIQNLTTTVTEVSWSLFLLAWAIGWALRGSPIPIFRVKRTGQDLLEDAIFAAFWLAIGSTIFQAITYIASQIQLG
ncbi:MAG: DNA import protein CedA1 [Sulfolobaceae archaeon]